MKGSELDGRRKVEEGAPRCLGSGGPETMGSKSSKALVTQRGKPRLEAKRHPDESLVPTSRSGPVENCEWMHSGPQRIP